MLKTIAYYQPELVRCIWPRYFSKILILKQKLSGMYCNNLSDAYNYYENSKQVPLVLQEISGQN